MKKVTISFIAAVVMVMFTSIAFAGPIDWLADQLGYTPTSTYELQKQETAKALLAAKAATEAATQLAATANFQSKVIDYGGLALVASLGGLAFISRKTIYGWCTREKVEKIQPGNKTAAVQSVDFMKA